NQNLRASFPNATNVGLPNRVRRAKPPVKPDHAVEIGADERRAVVSSKFDLLLSEQSPDVTKTHAAQARLHRFDMLRPHQDIDLVHLLVRGVAINRRPENALLEKDHLEASLIRLAKKLSHPLRVLLSRLSNSGCLTLPLRCAGAIVLGN